jgi:hypothetical protein
MTPRCLRAGINEAELAIVRKIIGSGRTGYTQGTPMEPCLGAPWRLPPAPELDYS